MRKFLLPSAAAMLAFTQIVSAAEPSYPFDGTYQGVSREVLRDNGSNNGRCFDQNGVPVPLVIHNGMVSQPTARNGGWQGQVNQFGVMVLRTPNAARLDAAIGQDGFIRGQLAGTGCVTNFVWRKA